MSTSPSQHYIPASPGFHIPRRSFSAYHYRDLRVTEMSGFDYVFAPAWVIESFRCLEEMQVFIKNVLSLFNTNPERLVMTSFFYEDEIDLCLKNYSLEWEGELLTDYFQEKLDSKKKLEFAETLFIHSEELIN